MVHCVVSQGKELDIIFFSIIFPVVVVSFVFLSLLLTLFCLGHVKPIKINHKRTKRGRINPVTTLKLSSLFC